MTGDAMPILNPYPLQEVVDGFGPPMGDGPMAPEQAARYRGRVPDALIQFWLTYGLGSWRDGLFWLCDPEPLMPVVRTLFEGDPEFDPDVIVPYFRDAFGDLIAWHPTLKVVDISFNLGEVDSTDITTRVLRGRRPFDDDHAVAARVSGAVFDMRGWVSDAAGGPVFEAVRARLGPIRADQVYAMTPHFRMGGAGAAEDFSIGGLVEYLGFLAQLSPFARMRYISPNEGGRPPYGHSERVRTIGEAE